MKHLLSASSVALFGLAAILSGCAAQTDAQAPDSSTDEALSASGAPRPAHLGAAEAMKQMEQKVPVTGAAQRGILKKVDVSKLPAKLATRFNAAKAATEQFGFAHSDLGDDDSEIDYVLSAPGASTFIGYVVFAEGSDDADRWSASSLAYYATDGSLLDTLTRSTGISDSEEAGDWTNVDDAKLVAEEAALKAAFTFDAKKQDYTLSKTLSTAANADALPFAPLVKMVQTELQASTYAHSDMGDDGLEFVSVKGRDGQIAGYILAATGSDDADFWHAAGYAFFSAQGQLLGRQISSAGKADNMDDDSVVLASP